MAVVLIIRTELLNLGCWWDQWVRLAMMLVRLAMLLVELDMLLVRLAMLLYWLAVLLVRYPLLLKCPSSIKLMNGISFDNGTVSSYELFTADAIIIKVTMPDHFSKALTIKKKGTFTFKIRKFKINLITQFVYPMTL